MSPGRFFLAVPLQSPYMLGGLALVVVLGMAELVLAPGSGQDAVVTLLLLQMFSASSGFAIPARRGHYDAILTGGSSRTAVVGWHLVMSVAPGLVGWLVLGACELGVGRSVVLSGGSIAAMVMVSAAGWAVTVPLPRLSGGVVWLVLLLAGLGWPTAGRRAIAMPGVRRSTGVRWMARGSNSLCAACSPYNSTRRSVMSVTTKRTPMRNGRGHDCRPNSSGKRLRSMDRCGKRTTKLIICIRARA